MKIKHLKAALSLLVFISGCSGASYYESKFPLMGATAVIKVESRGGVAECVKNAASRLGEISNKFNLYDSASELSVLNSQRTNIPIVASKDILKIIDLSKEMFEKTGGAFNPAISPVIDAWGFYGKEVTAPPGPDGLKDLLKRTSFSDVVVDRKESAVVFRKNGMKLDFNGIIAGYAADEAVKILKEKGAKNAIIDLGGEIYCLGKNRGRDWRVGVRDPFNKNNLVKTLSLSDKAVSTSGGYEKFKEIGGKTYPHILDPRTGYPPKNNVVSVTVVADDCVTADALSTAFFVMDARESIEVIKKCEGAACLIIKNNNGALEYHMSSNMKGFIAD